MFWAVCNEGVRRVPRERPRVGIYSLPDMGFELSDRSERRGKKVARRLASVKGRSGGSSAECWMAEDVVRQVTIKFRDLVGGTQANS